MTADEHVDTVVVGSGFGGAVSAYRLAGPGRSVVVLERGRAWPPGAFPRSPREMGRAFWDPDAGSHGLFDLRSFDGFESIVSSGLGGGSLIYANVLLRKDDAWFVRDEPLPGGGVESWPVTGADLAPHYDAVEEMLGATPYPAGVAPYAATPKTAALREAAQALGHEWWLPPLGVAFAPRPHADPAPGLRLDEPSYGNLHGLPRYTCDLQGNCNIGCNAGAKNSLDHTYLSAAAHRGADLRTSCEVRRVTARAGGGYVVDYLRHRPDEPGVPPDRRRVVADRVVLGAGAYGTTHLLLRSRAGLPGLGPALGTRFSGNGDLLTFLLPGARERVLQASRGPVITSTMRVGDTVDGGDGRGFYLQDGGHPAFVDWLIDTAHPAQAARTLEFVAEWLGRRVRRSEDPRMSTQMARLIGDGSLSSGSLPLLGMGRDVPDGVMSLDARGRLAVDWTTATSRDYLDRVVATMAAVSAELGTTLRENPLAFFRRIVTVHPLGGAPMGHDPTTGVCDDRGQVFGHPGLYVADGAAMPGAVGPNPSLTIAAHADRLAEGALEGRPVHTGRRPRRRRSRPTGLSFTEEMRGHLVPGATDPWADPGDGHGALLHLTITIDDVDAFVADPAHLASVHGWVESAALGGRRAVHDGWFNLFVPGPSPGSRRMVYRLPVTDGDGNRRTLVGHKEVRDDPGPDVWEDTTTLVAHLLDGHVGDAPSADPAPHPVTGAGILRIGRADLMRQLTTFRTRGPHPVAALHGFGRFFFGRVWEVYGPGG